MLHITHWLFFMLREGYLVAATWRVAAHNKCILHSVQMLRFIFYSSRLFSPWPWYWRRVRRRRIHRLKIFAAVPRRIQNGGSCSGPASSQNREASEWSQLTQVRCHASPQPSFLSRSEPVNHHPASRRYLLRLFFSNLVAVVDYHGRWLQDRNLAAPWRLNGRGRPRRQSCYRFHLTPQPFWVFTGFYCRY